MRAIIVDDERLARNELKRLLENFPSIEVVGEAANTEEASQLIEELQPDVAFLDIQMPTMDGFQFLDHLINRDFPVVITTAYDEYAIKALKHEAIDYLLKPIDSDDLNQTIEKIKKFNSKTFTLDKLEQILVNINSADQQMLETLPGIGPAKALQIINYRESNGTFKSIDELQDVSGIGTKIFEGLRDLIAIE